MTGSWRAGMAALLFGLPLAGAHARSGDEGSMSHAHRQVAQSCVTEYKRLCPAAELTGLRPRAMVLCLKPYKLSLSLGCRRAVNAASP